MIAVAISENFPTDCVWRVGSWCGWRYPRLTCSDEWACSSSSYHAHTSTFTSSLKRFCPIMWKLKYLQARWMARKRYIYIYQKTEGPLNQRPKVYETKGLLGVLGAGTILSMPDRDWSSQSVKWKKLWWMDDLAPSLLRPSFSWQWHLGANTVGPAPHCFCRICFSFVCR